MTESNNNQHIEEIHTHSPEHAHEHSHTHSSGHSHTHENTKAVLNRMAKIIGHMQSVKRMVEDGRDCSEVLIQLAAVNSAIHGVERVILKDHISHCLVEAVQEGDHEAIEKLEEAIDRFIK